MKALELLTEDKIPHLLKVMGPKLQVALDNDRYASSQLSTDEPTIEHLMKHMATFDPSGQKYLQWFAKQYANGIIKVEDFVQVRAALSLFTTLKPNLEKKDIGQYKTFAELDDAVSSNDVEPVDSKRQQKQKIKTEGADIIHKSPEYSILHIKTREAATYYGKGTKWCTASNAEEHNMFDYYSKDGPLYVLINHKTGRKVQFHWESRSFMNEQDEEIDMDYLGKLYPAMELTIHESRGAYDWASKVIKGPYPKGEHLIAKRMRPAMQYAEHILKGRFEAFEKRLLTTKDEYLAPEAASNYAEKVIQGRWPQAEKLISTDGEASYYYAKDTIKGRFPAGEHVILRNSITSFKYAESVIQGRWKEYETLMSHNTVKIEHIIKYVIDIVNEPIPELEPTIARYPKAAIRYAKVLLKGRFPAAEERMAQHPAQAIRYAAHVIKGRFPEGESRILEEIHSVATYIDDVLAPGERWPEFEKAIEADEIEKNTYDPATRRRDLSALVYRYALEVLQGRWPKAEYVILRIPADASRYALNVIQGRWPELEELIIDNFKNRPSEPNANISAAIGYGSKILKGRWPEIEQYLKSPTEIALYATKVMNKRWPEKEEFIKNGKTNVWSVYTDHFNIDESVMVDHLRQKAGL